MNLSEYSSYDAMGLADLIRSKEIQASELCDIALDAVAKVNPALNCVVGLTPHEAERARARGDHSAPFYGVPLLVKDLGLSISGVASEGGSRLLRGHIADTDCNLGARIKAAGFSIIGRTATPEFGNSASTEALAYGPTHNPWRRGASPGGSSGGAAAAIAAGIVPAAHASDGGGSIRVPASHCGVFGLKPTRGRTPSGPHYDELLFGLVCSHAITRSVRDSAAILDATAGADVGSRLLMPAPASPFLDAIDRPPGTLRIAFSSAPPFGAPSPGVDCVRMVEDVASLCQELGHDVFEAAPQVELDDLIRVFSTLSAAVIQHAVAGLPATLASRRDRSTLEATTLAAIERGAALSAQELMTSFDLVNRIARSVGAFFESCEVWLSPVAAGPAPALGFLNANDPSLSSESWTRQVLEACPYTTMFNVSGHPGMSVPLYWTAEGMPIGSQFVGRMGAEATLFSLAAQLESARPWARRRPPVHVAAL